MLFRSMLSVGAEGVFLDDTDLQSFSLLMVLFRHLMEHSLEKNTRISSINFIGIEKNKGSECPSQ